MLNMTRFIIEIIEYPSEEKISVEELTSDGAASLINDCESLLNELKDVARSRT